MRTILALMLLCLPLALAAQERSWRTGEQQIAWQPGEVSPVVWAVAAGEDEDGETRWHPLTTRAGGPDAGIRQILRAEGLFGDVDPPLSRHLSLHAPALENAWWEWLETETGVFLEAAAGGGQLAVTQHLSEASGDYRMRLSVGVQNLSAGTMDLGETLQLSLGPGLGEYPVEGLGIAESLYSYVQPVALLDGDLQRYPYDDDSAGWQEVAIEGPGMPGFAGLQSRYFALLLQPVTGELAGLRYRTGGGQDSNDLPARFLPQLALELPASALEPGEVRRWEFTVFAGPKTRSALYSDGAEDDYRALLFPGLWEWMRMLSFGLLWLLAALYSLIPSWGLAIILLAVLVRLAMYPVARRALESQAAFAEVQQRIQPEMQRIRREYSGAEQSERILGLYKEHGVSPLAGLKPLLIVMVQIPVFVALFHVLGQAFELRDASFLWMETLAEPDRLFAFGVDLPLLGGHFNLLPVLMALTTLLTLKLSPAPAADGAAQRRQTLFQVVMALGFLVLFYPFPAGMVLYWTMANLLHLLQQQIVERWSGAGAAA